MILFINLLLVAEVPIHNAYIMIYPNRLAMMSALNAAKLMTSVRV